MNEATIHWEDGHIRLHTAQRLSPEDYAAVKSEGFRYQPSAKVFKAAYTPERETLLRERFGLELAEDDTDLLAEAEARSERYAQYSANASAESDQHRQRSATISSGIPLGQPILVGHHSEGRHRRDLERIHTAERKRFEAADRSDYWARRAKVAVARSERRLTAPAIHRRIEELEAELRRQQRFAEQMAGKDTTRIQRWIWFYENRLAFERALLAAIPQEAQPLTRADLQKGGAIRYNGVWFEIRRVNPKTVSIQAWRLDLKRVITDILPGMYLTPAAFAAAHKTPHHSSGGFTIEPVAEVAVEEAIEVEPAVETVAEEATPEPSAVTVQRIPVKLIRAGNNDRKRFDENALRELAASIKERGLVQPITVRPMDGGAWYEIVAGERRYRAVSQILEWETIDALVRDLSDEEAAALMLVENTSRVDLDPMAEATAYNLRVERFGWSVAQIADVAGVSTERVRGRLRLLKLTEDIQHFVRTNQFPVGHAQLLVELDNNRQRIALRVFNSARSMPLARFEEVVAQLRQQQAEESQIDMFALELKLVEAVEADALTALRGKKARTGAPVDTNLPTVKVNGKDSVGDIMDRYIMELLQTGRADAAAAIGNIYNTLVAGNWVAVPAGSILAKSSDYTAEDAPVEKI